MSETTEYAVLRFLDTNGYSHMISDYVKGETLVQYLAKSQTVPKKKMLEWIVALIRQAEQYYKWENGEIYGWFMPYAVIFTESGEVLLLEPRDPENRELRGIMERKSVRELFVKSEHVLLQKKTPEDDAYGLGKTIQYFLAKCRTDTELTRHERRILKHVIERCTQGQEMTVTMLRELREEVKKCLPPGKREKRWKLSIGMAGILGTVLIAAGMIWGMAEGNFQKKAKASERLVSASEGDQRAEENEENTENKAVTALKTQLAQAADQYNNLCIETGLLYMYQLEESGLGRYYLSQAGEDSVLADCYLKINEYIQEETGAEETEDKEGNPAQMPDERQEEKAFGQVLGTGIEELEKLENGGTMDGTQTYLYYLPFVKAYAVRREAEDAVEEIRICKKVLKSMEPETDTEVEKRELEVRGYLAKASERAGEWGSAISEYEKLKEMWKRIEVKEMNELEKIYARLTEIYEETDQKEEMWKNCREAVETIPQSKVLWMQFIRLRCSDKTIDRAVCAETIKEAVRAVPELLEDEELQKIQQEYEVKVEEEQAEMVQ